jgi:hypothetical protein
MFGCGEQGAECLLIVLQAFGDQLAVDPVALLGLAGQCKHFIPCRQRIRRVGEDDADVLVGNLGAQPRKHHHAVVRQALEAR